VFETPAVPQNEIQMNNEAAISFFHEKTFLKKSPAEQRGFLIESSSYCALIDPLAPTLAETPGAVLAAAPKASLPAFSAVAAALLAAEVARL
jgi:hypothetical protein